MDSEPITPADLSRDLGVPQPTIRQYLRDRWGTLSATETRWALTDEQVEYVRARFGGQS